MKNFAVKFLVLLSLILMSAQNATAQNNQAKFPAVFVIAKINKKVITSLELIDRYRFVVFMSKIKINSAIERRNLLDQIVDKMIDEELIRQEAENLKIEVDPNEVQDAAEHMLHQQKKNLNQFKVSLIEHNLSYVNYLRQIEAEIAWSKIVSETMRNRVKITDFEVNEFFEQHKFSTSISKFLIAEIFIPEGQNSEIMAKKLVSELRAGADFGNIVKQFSRDSLTAENGGELGWVSQRDIDAKIYAAISKLKKNEYSDPVPANDGYYIFKVLNTKQETKVEEHDLNAAQNAIFIRKLQTVAKGHLADLRKKAFVEIDRDAIAKIAF